MTLEIVVVWVHLHMHTNMFFGTYSIISACTSQNNIYMIVGKHTPMMLFFHFWSSTVSHFGKLWTLCN